jgi:hypothetical protein
VSAESHANPGFFCERRCLQFADQVALSAGAGEISSARKTMSLILAPPGLGAGIQFR